LFRTPENVDKRNQERNSFILSIYFPAFGGLRRAKMRTTINIPYFIRTFKFIRIRYFPEQIETIQGRHPAGRLPASMIKKGTAEVPFIMYKTAKST
ncbi:MAG: hypothetical protein IJU10_03615, partial [Clostridia bacterium]|nr:hypothetical protein [Clostridia bacterium]